jgi:hypothetical protein
VYDGATGGTINQFNKAANRLRERLDSSAQGAQQQATSRNLGRGMGNSGAQEADSFRINQASQNAYASGLSDLENNFENQRQQGLQTALGAASQNRMGNEARNQLGQLDLSQLRSLGNSNYQFGSSQDQQNRQFMDSRLFDLINSREGRGSQERMNSANNTFQGQQNAAQRSLQEQLEELQQLNNNYRASVSMGTGQIPSIMNNPYLGNNNILSASGISGPIFNRNMGM